MRGEARLLSRNATGACSAYHTGSIKRTDTFGSRSTCSPDVRSFYYQQSSVASYNGSAMSAAMTRCRKLYYQEQWTVVVAEEDRESDGRTALRRVDGPSQSVLSLLLIADDIIDGYGLANHHSGGICRRAHYYSWALGGNYFVKFFAKRLTTNNRLI